MSPRRMSAGEARANFGDLLGSVYYTKEPVIIEKKGRPFVVVISPQDFEALQKEQERAWSVVDRVRERNTDKDPDEVLRDVTAEVKTVRQELYEESGFLAKANIGQSLDWPTPLLEALLLVFIVD